MPVMAFGGSSADVMWCPQHILLGGTRCDLVLPANGTALSHWVKVMSVEDCKEYLSPL